MKKTLIGIVSVLIVGLAAIVFWFWFTQLRGIGPALDKPPADIAQLIEDSKRPPLPGMNATDFPLTIPDGLDVSVFSKDVPSARVMVFDSHGNMWVSETTEGVIIKLDIQNGSVISQTEVFTDLQNPSGLAFDPQHPDTLYVAEENKLSRVDVYPTVGQPEKLVDFDVGGLHVSRTIAFGPDGRLYLSDGSSCNVCDEDSAQRAKIHVVDVENKVLVPFARGLRNSVFFTWHPRTHEMWATEMGRDYLGDDLPPDEINIIKPDANYGWPTCYGQNIHDTDFDTKIYIRNPCMEPFETPSYIDLPAHSAPLGLAFIPNTWPAEYRDDLLVAYHGSWNRSEPDGYKIVRVKLDASGKVEGIDDFVSGWLTEDGALGRPADLVFGSDGELYVSDDKAGLIYKMVMKP